MCVLLHLLISTALRAHIIVVEALYKIYYCNQVHLHIVFVLYSVCRSVSVLLCVDVKNKQKRRKKETE